MNQRSELSELQAGILDSLPEPVVLVDHLGNVLAANRAAEQEIGVTYPGRALALSFRHPAALAAVDRVLAGGGTDTVEVAIPAPAARTFRLRVAPLESRLMPGEFGRRGAALVFHDITAERRAEQMRADFVANASHELRSPLSALVGFIETLRGPARDDPAARDRFLEMMAAEGGRMARLIEDLLSLSAIEVNEHVAPSEKVDVVAVVQGVAEALGPGSAAAGVEVVLDLPDDLPQAPGDEGQLAQVFRNLLENAIAYGGRGSVVRVTARPEPRLPDLGRAGISVAVADQGPGIAREHLPRLTERFYRVDKARSREAGGTGLGLAIVKHILNRHRGRLLVESTAGAGSTFTVLLPSV